MEFNWTSISLGAVLGSLITIGFQAWLTNRFQTIRVLKEEKVRLLRDLMATRFSNPLDQKAAEAINFIPVLFAGRQKVLKSYAEYHDTLINNGQDTGYKFNGLITEIAKDIKITFGPLDLMRSAIRSHEMNMKMEKFGKEYAEWQKSKLEQSKS